MQIGLDNVLAAARRSEQARCEQVSRWESLDFGVAFTAPAFAGAPEGNQLRDAWLAGADPEDAYRRAEAYYTERGLSCLRWTPASGQKVSEVEALLAGKGWRRRNLLAMGLADYQAFDRPEDSTVRILPARAMPKAFRQALAPDGAKDNTTVDIGVERLNDSRYEAFVAMVDGRPVGRAGYLEVGDIARLADFHVVAGVRAEAGPALIAHFLCLVRRLTPRIVVTCVDENDAAGRALFEKCGFAAAGALPQFDRP